MGEAVGLATQRNPRRPYLSEMLAMARWRKPTAYNYDLRYPVVMIAAKLDQIDESAVEGLLFNAVSESKTLEYKSVLPGLSDAEKKEFLADVSALANTRGGDLVYGIAEDKGVPTDIPGVVILDPDRDTTRIESLINSGIRPRIRYETKLIRRAAKDPVFLIRVQHSWNGPHRVEYAGHNKFYARKFNVQIRDGRR
jgi:predicted HTH transcriptional regulator